MSLVLFRWVWAVVSGDGGGESGDGGAARRRVPRPRPPVGVGALRPRAVRPGASVWAWAAASQRWVLPLTPALGESHRRHVRPAACQTGGMSDRRHVRPAACQTGGMSDRRHVRPAACQTGGMSDRRHVRPAACRETQQYSEKQNRDNNRIWYRAGQNGMDIEVSR